METADELRRVGAFFAARGWLPATSGNLSARLSARTIAMTRTGVDKSELSPDDFVELDIDEPLPAGVSAEAPLHVARYRAADDVGAVLHVHSVASTVLSRRHAAAGALVLEGFEMLKSLQGVTTHASSMSLPIFANTQDIDALAPSVEKRIAEMPRIPGFLLAGHGLYAWGTSIAEARRHIEGFEFLLACALEEGRLAR